MGITQFNLLDSYKNWLRHFLWKFRLDGLMWKVYGCMVRCSDNFFVLLGVSKRWWTVRLKIILNLFFASKYSRGMFISTHISVSVFYLMLLLRLYSWYNAGKTELRRMYCEDVNTVTGISFFLYDCMILFYCS